MKKFFILLTMILATNFIFASNHSHNHDQEAPHNNAFFFDLGTSFYTTNLADEFYPLQPMYRFFKHDFFAEAGKFISDEDGIADFVRWDLGGFSAGYVNTQYNFGYLFGDNVNRAVSNALKLQIHSKESLGFQLNFFAISAGSLFGIKSSVEFLSFEAETLTPYMAYRSFHNGINAGFDFSINPYISINLARIAKIFIMGNIDLPVLHFTYAWTASYRTGYIGYPALHLFSGDIPLSVAVGFCFFL